MVVPGNQTTFSGTSMVSVGNTNMAFNVDTGSSIQGANESSSMSDVTGSGCGDDSNANTN
jgi:hypothetical protein